MRRPPQRPDRRSDARERALYLLYEAQAKGISPVDALELQIVEPDELTTTLVRGVDDAPRRGSTRRSPPRPRAGRWSGCRCSTSTCCASARSSWPSGPTSRSPSCIDEAVELAKRFSTDNSGRFVNGVLGALVADLRPPAA